MAADVPSTPISAAIAATTSTAAALCRTITPSDLLSAPRKPTLALVAHDAKKADMIDFTKLHKDKLSRFNLIGTGTTAGLIKTSTGLEIEACLSGPLGGDQQIGARLATGGVQLVVFLVDPLSSHPHEPDIQGLVRVCCVHGVPLALNRSSAEFFLACL
jgi:methylglyoxal synthase